ncbi:hypothetical protein SR882_10245 [Guyparkeria halophila]|uniref:Tip attachment protein J domain-containing protein n=1 Tax=Guyparkeria halophila TaxID=47960 RepID=A0ABZ0YY75_9GAMM|nr:hypothetical protein [Guyparkeria halophila]WQH16130.1 hypothetical protein SR882_10245 [Guyparkeria halophila]
MNQHPLNSTAINAESEPDCQPTGALNTASINSTAIGGGSACASAPSAPDYEVGQPAVELRLSVYSVGAPIATLDLEQWAVGTPTLSIAASVSAPTGQPRAYLRPRLYAVGQPTAGLATSAGMVIGTGSPSAALVARTYTADQPTGGLLARVIGEIDWSDVAASQRWSVVTRIDGAEVLTAGAIEIEAEESSARLCTLSVVGPPAHDVGHRVEVTLHVGDHIEPMFRGEITEPEYDPARGLTTYTATDQIQQRIDALSREQIDALTPEATTARDNEDEGWDYLRHRLESWPGSLDLTRDGQFRATRWDDAEPLANPIPAAIDGSESLSLVSADQIRNRVVLTARLSWLRLAARVHDETWTAPYSICEFLTGRGLGYQPSLPSTDTIAEAIESAGWQVESANSQQIVRSDTGSVSCDGQRIGLVGEFDAVRQASWTLSRRYSRSMQAEIGLTLEAPESVSRFGERPRSERLTYREDYDDSAWRSTEGPLADDMGPLDATDPRGDHVHDTLDQAGVEAIVTDAINRATREMASAHRRTSLTLETLVRPDIERHHRPTAQLPSIEAAGKIARIVHRLDTDAGGATTELELRVFRGGTGDRIQTDWTGLGALAIGQLPTREDDAEALPAPGTYVGGLAESEPESEDWQGWIFNANTETGWWADESTYDPNAPENETYQTGFAVRTPPITLPDQEDADLRTERCIAVTLPEDPLILTGA